MVLLLPVSLDGIDPRDEIGHAFVSIDNRIIKAGFQNIIDHGGERCHPVKAVQHYMFVRNRIWESLLLLVIAFSMFRPDFWQDRVSPPYIEILGHEVLNRLGDDGPNGLAGDQRLRVQLSEPDFDDADRILQRNAILELDGALTAVMRLEQAGLMLDISDGIAIVEEPFPGMPLFQEFGDFAF